MKQSFRAAGQICKIFSSSPQFSVMKDYLQSEHNQISISGISSTAQLSVFIATLQKEVSKPVLIIFYDDSELEAFLGDIESFISPKSIAIIPGYNRYNETESYKNIQDFLVNDAVRKMIKNCAKIIITTVSSFNIKLPKYTDYRNSILHLKIGNILPRKQVLNTLNTFHYSREFTVEYPGEFSIRGEILDIFPLGCQQPYRVEFFDDRIESIRIFSIESQQTISKQKSIDVFSNIKSQAGYNYSLFDYLPKDICLTLPHTDTHRDALGSVIKIFSASPDFKIILLNDIATSEITFPIHPTIPHIHTVKQLKNYLKQMNINNISGKCFLFCSSSGQADRLSALIDFKNITCIRSPLSAGFTIPSVSLYIYSDSEIFPKRQKPKSFAFIPSNIEHSKIDPTEINYNDLVVHIDYGIGKYLGLKKVTAFDATRECLVLGYQNSDNVFIPLEKMSLVHKYRASGGYTPRLSKLGSVEWDRTKLYTKRSINLLSDEIIALYSKRVHSEGFSFSPDNEFQMSMEAEFAFDETIDQARVAEEIKADMEKAVPMDRLLCGDVGFGKTEVAIRAAFKAVSDSKQVAVLAPTTILADQHYISFKERLKKYPVSVSRLSRFVKKSQQNQIIKELSSGRLDIIIGTHRLLSEGVKFSDLGLLIIDEEHRFGVKDKDEIKKYRTNIDVLSLSATPIPRSLHFSLIGARDFSLINTAPKERLPILTEIISFDKNIIKRRILQEMNRGGQVFFVHNEIHTIASVTKNIQEMFPYLTVRYIHGKMSENIIEPIMLGFMNGDINILVTTTIIESGIDIPNANTIFINKAQNLGLSQLYQLRGRVGRLDRQAYCYLIVSNTTHLNPKAIQRLQTIKRHTALGSGYSIALEDLEIRGAGNVFGLEQSGNIHAIGYDLYIKILRDSLNEKKESNRLAISTENADRIEDINITFPFPAFFPDSYIASESLRLKYYKKLSSLESVDEMNAIHNGIMDIFGRTPPEVDNLFDLITIKLYCSWLGIKRLIIHKNYCNCLFIHDHKFNNTSTLISLLKETATSLCLSFKFLPSKDLSFLFYPHGVKKIELIKQFLYHLEGKLNLSGNQWSCS